MNKLLKKLKAIFAKGFATAEEKAELRTMFKELGGDEQETVKEDVEKAEGLPESNPQSETTDEDIQKGVRDLVKAASATAIAEVKQLGEDIKSEVEAWLEQQAEL